MNLKPINFKRLECLVNKKPLISESKVAREYSFNKGKIIHNVVVTKDGTLKTRTHNIQLIDNYLWYENNNSIGWSHKFNSIEEANKWWNDNIKID